MSRQSDLDNHANQMNPNNDAYWESRGDGEHVDYAEQSKGSTNSEEKPHSK